MLVSSLYRVSGLLPLQPIYPVVPKGKRPVLRVVRYYPPLVVVRGQRGLGDALRGDLVPSGPQGVEPRPVRHAVEEAVLVILEGYAVFHHGLLHAFALLVGLSIVHLVGVKFRSQPHELGDGLTAGLVFHHPQHLFVCATDGMSLRVVAGVEPFGDVPGYVLVEVLYLDSVTEGVGVREQESGSVPVLRFDVHVMKVIHQGLGKVQEGLPEVDGFVQDHRGLSHSYRNQLRVLVDERSPVVRFGNEPFQYLGILSVHYLDLRPLPDVLHGLAEDAVVHELEEVFLKLVLGHLPGLRVAGDVFFQELALGVSDTTVDFGQLHPVLQVLL